MSIRINYATQGGYDERDGLDLDCGRWMWDDQRNVQVWVQIKEPPIEKPGPKAGPRTAECIDCQAEVDRRALRCRSCASIEDKRVKRDWARKARSDKAA